MRVITVGYSTFNADALESLSLEELKERYPNMRADVFKELSGKLGIKKAKKSKKVDESTEEATD